MFLLRSILPAAACVMGLVACVPSASPNRTSASYDRFTQRLVQISADQNGDGRIDQWTYLDGNRPIRGEADVNGDGRIDRWEYFDAQAALTHVGTSSADDGIEDTWTWPPGANGELRVERARQRDRRVDHREFFRGTTLLRSEEDSNADGRFDRWDVYDGDVLRQVAFDTTFAAGRPTRRVIYSAAGQFERVEEDADMNGTFEAVRGAEPAETRRGVRR